MTTSSLYDRLHKNTLVGAFVYKPSRPDHCGIVVKHHLVQYNTMTRVQWLDGTVSSPALIELYDFEATVADQRETLAANEAILLKLQALRDEINPSIRSIKETS